MQSAAACRSSATSSSAVRSAEPLERPGDSWRPSNDVTDERFAGVEVVQGRELVEQHVVHGLVERRDHRPAGGLDHRARQDLAAHTVGERLQRGRDRLTDRGELGDRVRRVGQSVLPEQLLEDVHVGSPRRQLRPAYVAVAGVAAGEAHQLLGHRQALGDVAALRGSSVTVVMCRVL